ncbi:hypothetical protein EYV94_15680 [Puteibacter caeruleilacunae]|nr:hypothetical protein EYV94_15680 [Puteibacter caeruleilacunae]
MHQINKVWQKIAQERNGKFKRIRCIGPSGIDSINSKIMRYELNIPSFQNSNNIISSSEKQPIKVEYLFNNQCNTDFLIHPKDFIEKIKKLFGASEIEIGDKVFDEWEQKR